MAQPYGQIDSINRLIVQIVDFFLVLISLRDAFQLMVSALQNANSITPPRDHLHLRSPWRHLDLQFHEHGVAITPRLNAARSGLSL